MSRISKTRVVVLGNTQVGKTSIVTRYAHPQEELHNTYQATIGIDFMSKQVPMEPINFRFQIWDTSGQERYRSLAMTYLQETDAVLVVYDISNAASFESVRSWVESIRDSTSLKESMEEKRRSPVIVLVGNKTDIVDNRKVSTEEGRNLALELGVGFWETSAKKGDNINALFESLVGNSSESGPKRSSSKRSQHDVVDLAAMPMQPLPENPPRRCNWSWLFSS